MLQTHSKLFLSVTQPGKSLSVHSPPFISTEQIRLKSQKLSSSPPHRQLIHSAERRICHLKIRKKSALHTPCTPHESDSLRRKVALATRAQDKITISSKA